MPDLSNETLSSLADKIDSLDLTDDEQALLELLCERASEVEPGVSGFAYHGLRSGADMSPLGFKLGTGLGIYEPEKDEYSVGPKGPTY